ncbi:MAG TPA: DUF4907 domain-containing protein [Puia sp.]|nr:DUF4907 domain-containing protein [Puia sp.]
MTIKKEYYRLITIVVLIAAVSAAVYYARLQKKNEKVFVQAQAIQTKYGWGYNIVANGKTFIHQEFIPAISGRHGFATKEEALMVGRLVIDKMSLNQLPTINLSDLRQLGIIKDSFAAK